MMSTNSLMTDEELRHVLQQEDQILALLKTAKEMERSLTELHWDLRERAFVVEHKEPTSESAARIAQRLTCDLLLSRLSRNDKDTVVVDCDEFPPGYGESLGKALANNTMVTTLTLNAHSFLPPGVRTIFPAAQPLRNFLLTCSSAVNVRLRHGARETPVQLTDQVFSFFLETVCASNVMQNLVVRDRPVSPLEFKSLMTEPLSLLRLNVNFASQRWTNQDKLQVTEGLESNRSGLHRLALHIDDDWFNNIGNGEDPMPTHVVKHLHLVPSLQELVLEFSDYFEDMFGAPGMDEIFNALEHYLQSVDSLRRLGFTFAPMCETLMTKLLSGLVLTSGAPVQRIAIAEVTFAWGSFDVGSSNRLFAFLQTPITGENGTIAYESALRKLCLGVSYLYGDDDLDLTNEQQESWWERFAESLLVQESSTLSGVVQTIGSQIEELHIDNVHPSFLHYMAINVGRVRVKHLGLHGRVPDTTSECLPKLWPVTSLTLKDVYVERRIRSGIVEGLKLSGSITAVSTGRTALSPFEMSDCGLYRRIYVKDFDEKQQRLMHAYTQRNEFLGLYRGGLATEQYQGTADAAPPDASKDCELVPVGASQVPSILHTAIIGPATHLHRLVKADVLRGPDGQFSSSNHT